MGPWGALVLGFFGGVFFAAATIIASGWQNPYLVIPILIIAIIASLAWRRIADTGPGAHALDARRAKIIRRSTIAEGIGIPIVSTALGITGHPALILPGITAVVGLHFVPMGLLIPSRPFAIVAGLLLLTAAIGMFLPSPASALVTGVAAALALWTAAAFALIRPRR